MGVVGFMRSLLVTGAPWKPAGVGAWVGVLPLETLEATVLAPLMMPVDLAPPRPRAWVLGDGLMDLDMDAPKVGVTTMEAEGRGRRSVLGWSGIAMGGGGVLDCFFAGI